MTNITVETNSLLVKNIPAEIIDHVMDITNTFIKAEGLDTGTVMTITTNIMSALGKYNNISGQSKKNLVILIINAVIDQTSLDETTQTVLQTMVTTTIPTAIDLFVAVSKGKYKFKDAKRFFTWCGKCCKC
jgi:hypothetical protein